MTVEELISELKKHDSKIEIYTMDSEYGGEVITSVDFVEDYQDTPKLGISTTKLCIISQLF